MIEWMKRRYIGWQIASGRRPRGRQSGVSPEAGGHVLRALTELTIKHFRADGSEVVEDRQVVHNRKFTTAARDAIIDAFDLDVGYTLSNFRYHDCGTGVNAEANTDTVLQTAVTEARVEGTHDQPTSDVYRTVATITFANPYAVTEHGIFSQAAKPGGVLLDRTVHGAINVASGDSIQYTFTFSMAAEA